MINFFKDLLNFIRIQKKVNQKKICFFNESEFTFQYLQPYIRKKLDRKNILIMSFCDIKIENKNLEIIIFKTNFFRELYFLTSKNRIIYSSTPDLNNSIFRTSKVQKNKYIYLQHSSVGLIKAYNKEAFIYFDAIQATNKFQYDDVNYINKVYNTKIKKFKSTYRIFRKLNSKLNNEIKCDVLIAPTWSTNFYNEEFYEMIKKLKRFNFKVLLRPHPMSLKKKELNINLINEIGIEIDRSNFPNLQQVKNLISDHSGIFIEFMMTNKRKPILINTEEKDLNKKSENRTSFERYLRDNYSVQTSFKEMTNNDFSVLKLTDGMSLSETNFLDNFY